MFGLTVRWSLTGTPPGTLDELRRFVEDTGFTRFAGLDGLRFKTWRASEGHWFEGTYVFVSDEARARFQSEVESSLDDLPGSQIVGSPPELVQECEIVAVVRGPAGFRSAARFET